MRPAGRLLASAAVLAWLAGCAATAPKPAGQPVPPATGATTGTRVGSTASGGNIVAHEPSAAPAVVDSAPSPEALEVLSTIPEPLGGKPAPEGVTIPVPGPTEPLGDRSGAAMAQPDSPAPPPVSARAAAPVASGAATAGGAPDSCWRVQVAAPPDRERAERMAQVAQSQLSLPFVVEREGGLYKVRTRECLPAGAAAALRNRALASGFDGSFRFPRPKP